MTAATVSRGKGAARLAPAAGPTLAARVRAGFALLLVLVALLVGVAARQAEGPALAAVLALGGAALAAAAALARWLLRQVVAPLAQVAQVAGCISSGDLTQAVPARATGELGGLLRSLQELQQRLFGVVSQVRTGTTTVAATSSQITRDNEALSRRTDTQVASLQETATSIDQLSAAVRQNAENAQQAHALVQSASARAAQGGAVMENVVQTMGSIRESSRSIVDIIGVIDGIAFQTNILALNAAVEAARAGEQGRGFAVVAGEVRVLAQRSATAAREIKALIGDAVGKVDAGGSQVDDAGRAMAEIVAAVDEVARLIGQISVASREQSVGIEAVNRAVALVDRGTQDNAALVQDMARTTTALNEQAVRLLQAVADFRLGAREHGNRDEAMALVRRACEFCAAHGREALVADVNKAGKGRFTDRDLYLMVIDVNEVVLLAHGNNVRNVGMGPQSRDADGKLFLQEMAKVARSQRSGWVDHKWAHPVTNAVMAKANYVQLAGDVAVVCGIYKDRQGD